MAIRSTVTMLAIAATIALAACNPGNGGQNSAAGDVAAAGNTASADAAPAQPGADATIAETIAGSADHSTLLAAFRAAGLEATLAGPGPYTVFAPTNAGFEALPAGTLDTLMKPENKGRLTAVLTYHVVPGVVTLADLAKAVQAAGGIAQLATLGGGNLKISGTADALVITDAKGGQARIAQADMAQSNGVVHSVDGVLMPN